MARQTIMRTKAARDVQPGHITADGIVIGVGYEGGQRRIRHRNVVYLQEPDSMVQIFGRVPNQIVISLRKAIEQEAAQ